VKFPGLRVFLCLALLVLAVGSAQTSSKQKDLDAIVARAADTKNPQPVDVNKKQLEEWSAKYHVKLQSKILPPQRVSGHGGAGPIAAPDIVCPLEFRHEGLRCVLLWYETDKDGRPTSCHYFCE
jgi:hypothetical protein